jgi:CRP-like cAMP-binding protein
MSTGDRLVAGPFVSGLTASGGSCEDPSTVDAKSLERVPLFAGLSHREREQVARWADEIDIPSEKHLLHEGRLPHEFFVILDGEVEVTHDGEHLATLTQGDFFGEIALIEHGRRTASVTTSSPVTLAVMSGPSFDAMRHEMPQVAERINAAIRERLAR